MWYINQKCNRCRRSLTGGYIPNYYIIDKPFTECTKCGAINIHSDNSNEWELFSWFRRVRYFLLTLYWGVGYGVLLWLATIWALPIWGPASVVVWMENLGTTEGPFFVALFILLGLFIAFFGVFRAIIQSNIRMKNPYYRHFLKQMGLLKK